VLLPLARAIAAVDGELAAQLTRARIEAIVAAVADAWLEGDAFGDATALRAAYVDYLCRRLHGPRGFAAQAQRAHAAVVEVADAR
jgi:hypothetical protein